MKEAVGVPKRTGKSRNRQYTEGHPETHRVDRLI